MVGEPKDKAHRERKDDERGQRAVATFRVSHKGFRRIFAKHFGADHPCVETLAYHLAQVEASLPTTREAIRLARYPKAGDRNPKRFALGLMENLEVLQSRLAKANAALQELASGKCPEPNSEEE